MYSGPVAAHAYRLLRGRAFDVAVLVGPSHFVGFDGVVDLSGAAASRRRSASRAIDEDVRAALAAATPIVHEHAAAHAREHSLEMQLPFLQHLAPDVPIVPLLMGYQTADTARALGDALAAALRGRRALLVASTDLSHYHDAGTAARLDRVVIDCVARFDADGLQARARRAAGARVRRRTDRRGDARRPRARRPRRRRPQLRRLGRRVGRQVGGGRLPGGRVRPVLDRGLDDERRRSRCCCWPSRATRSSRMSCGRPRLRRTMSRSCAARRAGGVRHAAQPRRSLRGCIGHVEADEPLGRVVSRCAVAAASDDPRFPPVARPSSRRSRSNCRCSVRSSRLPDRRRSRSAATAWSSNAAGSAACCCRRSPPNGTGTSRRSSRRPATRPACRDDAWKNGAQVVAVRGRSVRREGRKGRTGQEGYRNVKPLPPPIQPAPASHQRRAASRDSSRRADPPRCESASPCLRLRRLEQHRQIRESAGR